MTIQLSPLQLEYLVFTKTYVEVYEPFEVINDLLAAQFDFDGVNLQVQYTVSQQKHSTTNFLVTLNVAALNNEAMDKKTPYTFDVSVQGVFKLADSFECDNRYDVVQVNGAAMLYGAIREMLQQVTARSILGPLLLPTLHFLPESTGNKKS